jgi:DNA-directed RNA polymerase subunit alpha
MTQVSQVPRLEIRTLEEDGFYGKFAVEPLERGFGITLGNPLRRVLLGQLPGAAVTWVKIEGVLHEFSSMPNAKEEVMEFLLNVRGIRIKPLSERPGRMRLEVSGERAVTAADILAVSDFEIVNPDLHLATLGVPEARLSVEMNVELGKGYVQAEHEEGLPIGVLPLDAIFTPVRKVNYEVEKTRVGQVIDYERLILEIWTDGAMTPVEALRKAASILVEQFFIFSNAGKVLPDGRDRPPISLTMPAEQYNMLVERLELSSRTLNCLKRANLNKVGEVLEVQKSDLLLIRNFGKKSLDELYGRLHELGLVSEEEQEEEAPEEEATDTPEENQEEEQVLEAQAAPSED